MDTVGVLLIMRSQNRVVGPSLKSETYTLMRKALIEGTFKPGQRLSEPELALRFGTSRSPVREALSRLEQEGFIDRAASGYVRVKELSIADFQKLYALRACVEGFAVRLATPRLRTLDLEEMNCKLDEMERCIKRGNVARAVTAGKNFHNVVARECGNELVVELLGNLRARISRFRILVASLGNYDMERINEYRRILKAMYQRDPQRAEAEMIQHVERSAAIFVAKLQKKIGPITSTASE